MPGMNQIPKLLNCMVGGEKIGFDPLQGYRRVFLRG